MTNEHDQSSKVTMDAVGNSPSAEGTTVARGTHACQAPSGLRPHVEPRNEIEAGVAEILASLVSDARVGAHDNFILLGGESLRAAQAAWRIRDRYGCEVTLRSILAGTVADIAAEIAAARANSQP